MESEEVKPVQAGIDSSLGQVEKNEVPGFQEGIDSSHGLMGEGSDSERRQVECEQVEKNQVSGVQAGIDSSLGQIGEGSDSEPRQVEKNDVPGVHSGGDAAHGQLGDSSKIHQVKRKRDNKKHDSRKQKRMGRNFKQRTVHDHISDGPQAGIDSSDRQMGEGSESERRPVKRRRVEKSHVSGVQAGIDSSLGQTGEGSDTERRQVEKNHGSVFQEGIDSSHGLMGEGSDSEHRQVECEQVEKNQVSGVQAGIDSSLGQIGEGSDSEPRQVEKNDVPGPQAGIDSSGRQMGEGSESELPQVKRTSVEKNHVSGVQTGVDASHGQLGGSLETHHVKHESVNKIYKGTRMNSGSPYAKMALKFYEKSNFQEAKFELEEVVYSICAYLVVPGYDGVREWCHIRFNAKPRNTDCSDVSPKQFFGELVLDHVSRKHKVTHCSIFDPTAPGLTYGCVFCPMDPLFLHPFDGYLIGDLSGTMYTPPGSTCPTTRAVYRLYV